MSYTPITEQQLEKKVSIDDGRIEFLNKVLKAFDNFIANRLIQFIPVKDVKLTFPITGKISVDYRGIVSDCYEFLFSSCYYVIREFEEVIKDYIKRRYVIEDFVVKDERYYIKVL